MLLRIANFQRVVEATIEVSGLTFLRGKNNHGKSSCVRALHALICGRPGDDHVHWDAKKATVGAEFPADPDNDPVSLAWVKGSAGAAYYINEEKFPRSLGRRGVPTQDLEKHGLREIEFAGGRHNLMFALQDDGHFLVTLPPTQVFDYVSRILQEREIIPVIKAMSRDSKSFKEEAILLEGEIGTRARSIRSWEEELSKLTPVVEREEDFLSLRRHVVKLRRMEEVKEEILDVQARMGELNERSGKVKKFLDSAAPKLEAYEKEVTRLAAMEAMFVKVFKVEGAIEENQVALTKVNQVLENIPDLAKAEDLISKIEEAKKELDRMEQCRKALLSVQTLVQENEEALTKADQKIAEAVAQYKQVRDEIGICPTCGNEMGESHGK